MNSKNVCKVGLRTCDEFGFCRIMQEMLRIYKLARDSLKVKSVTQKVIDVANLCKMKVLLSKNEKCQERRVMIRFHVEHLMLVYVANFDGKIS